MQNHFLFIVHVIPYAYSVYIIISFPLKKDWRKKLFLMRKHNYTYRKYACADCIHVLVQVVVAGNFRRWSGLISRTVHAIELISRVGDNPRNLDPQKFPAIRVFPRFLFPYFPISSFLISCSSFYTDPAKKITGKNDLLCFSPLERNGQKSRLYSRKDSFQYIGSILTS